MEIMEVPAKWEALPQGASKKSIQKEQTEQTGLEALKFQKLYHASEIGPSTEGLHKNKTHKG